MKNIYLYTRNECHLCEIVQQELESLTMGKADLSIIYIDNDLELLKRYGLRIPVVTGDNGELSGYPLDSNAILNYLK